MASKLYIACCVANIVGRVDTRLDWTLAVRAKDRDAALSKVEGTLMDAGYIPALDGFDINLGPPRFGGLDNVGLRWRVRGFLIDGSGALPETEVEVYGQTESEARENAAIRFLEEGGSYVVSGARPIG